MTPAVVTGTRRQTMDDQFKMLGLRMYVELERRPGNLDGAPPLPKRCGLAKPFD